MSEQNNQRQFKPKVAHIRQPNGKPLSCKVAQLMIEGNTAIITDTQGNTYIVSIDNVLIKGEWVDELS